MNKNIINENKFFKKSGFSVSIWVVLTAILIIGGTFAVIVAFGGINVINGKYATETTCFNIDYDVTNDDGTLPISGILFPSSGYSGGLFGRVSMKINRLCSTDGIGKLNLNVVSASNILTQVVAGHCENKNTLETVTKYTTESTCVSKEENIWVTTGTALKYAVFDNKSELPVSVGYVDRIGSIEILNNIILSKTASVFNIYIWLDGNISDGSFANLDFNANISGSAEQVEDYSGGTSSAATTSITWNSSNYSNVITANNYSESGSVSVGTNSVTFNNITSLNADEFAIGNLDTVNSYDLTNVDRISITLSDVYYSNADGNEIDVYISLYDDSGDVAGSLTACSIDKGGIVAGGTCSSDVSGFAGKFKIVVGLATFKLGSTNPSVTGTLQDLKLISYSNPTQISWTNSNYSTYFNKNYANTSNTNVDVGNNTVKFYAHPNQINYVISYSEFVTKTTYNLTNVDMISINTVLSNFQGIFVSDGGGGYYLAISKSPSPSSVDDYEKLYYGKTLGTDLDWILNSILSIDVSDLTGDYYISFGGYAYNGTSTGSYIYPQFQGPLMLYG